MNTLCCNGYMAFDKIKEKIGLAIYSEMGYNLVAKSK